MRWLSHGYLVQYGQCLSFSPILLLCRSPIYWSYYSQDCAINNAYWLILISYIVWKSTFVGRLQHMLFIDLSITHIRFLHEYALLVLFLYTASVIFCQNSNLYRLDSFWQCSNKLKNLYLFSTSSVIKIYVVVI